MISQQENAEQAKGACSRTKRVLKKVLKKTACFSGMSYFIDFVIFCCIFLKLLVVVRSFRLKYRDHSNIGEGYVNVFYVCTII